MMARCSANQTVYTASRGRVERGRAVVGEAILEVAAKRGDLEEGRSLALYLGF